MADTSLLDEYVLNDVGAIFTGSHRTQYPREWYFGQVIYTVDGLIFAGYQFSWFSWKVQPSNSSTHEIEIFYMNYEGKCYSHEF